MFGCVGCDDCIFHDGSHGDCIYEIHITTNHKSALYVKGVGDAHDIKIVDIHLGDMANNHVMTSQRFVGSHIDMLTECARIYSVFEKNGINVSRTKIEAFPSMELPFVYYETHIQLKIPKKEYDYIKSNLNYYLNEGWHFSRNAFKSIDESYIYMITYRSYDKNIEKIEQEIINTCGMLDILQIKYEKIIKEQCVYDSNEDLDHAWMKKEK